MTILPFDLEILLSHDITQFHIVFEQAIWYGLCSFRFLYGIHIHISLQNESEWIWAALGGILKQFLKTVKLQKDVNLCYVCVDVKFWQEYNRCVYDNL